jgi:hypothetical protein
MINAGWANNCGIELFTIGWVQCPSGEAPAVGGGESKGHWIEAPGRGRTYELAQYEDEEIIAVLQALLASRTIN